MRRATLAALLVAGLPCGVALGADVADAPSATAPPAQATEDRDLELIPAGSPQSSADAAPVEAGPVRRVYLENALSFSSQRDEVLVPPPAPPPYEWQSRLLLDWRQEWRLGGLRLNVSDRLNLRFENDIDFPSRENLLNELRELYVSAEPSSRSYLDLGRINLKSGIALGYNPTDYFKARAAIEPLSLDPTVLRENRLGTVMVRAQHVWERASLTAAFAPALSEALPLRTPLDLPSFDPMLGLTNSESRVLLKGSIELASSLSPEFLLYRGGDETSAGFNLAANVGQRMVAYLEWSGGRHGTLVAEALGFGRETGTLPPGVSGILPADPRRSFMNQVALGFSYTTPTRITLNLEYHYNQAGFTAADWNRWFTVGQAGADNRALSDAAWYIRDYALDQQEPATQHSLFLRADWVDAFVPKLELVGFVNTDLRDGSSLLQLNADYTVSDRWTVGALAVASLGPRRSDFGSLPQSGSVQLRVVRYL